MIVGVSPDIDSTFRKKFPYPIPMCKYPPGEYSRVGAISDRWAVLYIVIGVLFFLAYAVGLMFVLQWVNAGIYSLLPDSGNLFPQFIPPFSIPAMFLAFSPGVLTALGMIRLFYPKDYKQIFDLLNVRFGYDCFAAWRWLFKILLIFGVGAMLAVSWCYVYVSPRGIDIKNVFSYRVNHYDYSDVLGIRHYSTYSDNQGVHFADYCELYFKDGSTFFKQAPEVDRQNCIKHISELSGIPILEGGARH